MGITIREIVEVVGGGIKNGRRFKAVQLGGPSGGCIPERLADTPIDYEAIPKTGAIMGSGGLVVMDDRDCMVDIARFFLRFTQAESCGKCTFCRIGTKRMLEILDRICTGNAYADDLDRLETLADYVSRGSLCGLGQTAPNPVLTTLRYFRDEYLAAQVDGGAAAPQLTGKRPAQAPRLTLTTGFTWDLAPQLTLSANARYESDRFEDDLNTRILPASVGLDARAEWRMGERTSLYLAVENLAA